MANLNYLSILWILAFAPISFGVFFLIYQSYLYARRKTFGVTTEATVLSTRCIKNQSGWRTATYQYYVEYQFDDERQSISTYFNQQLVYKYLGTNNIPKGILNIIIEYIDIEFYYGPFVVENQIERTKCILLSKGDKITIKHDSKYHKNARMIDHPLFVGSRYNLIFALVFSLVFVFSCMYGMILDINRFPVNDQVIILFIVLGISVSLATVILIIICRKDAMCCFNGGRLMHLRMDLGFTEEI